MRSAFIISIALVTMFSCAKKTTPAASTATRPIETKAPDDIKIAAVAPTESVAAIAGHATYDAKCGRCHGLKDPADYTATDWVPIMDKMAPKARLDSTEKANVMAYVSFHARPVK